MILGFFQKTFECSFLAIHAPKMARFDLLAYVWVNLIWQACLCRPQLSKYQLLITLPRLVVDYVSQCDHCSTASLVHEIELHDQWRYVKEKEILLSEQKQVGKWLIVEVIWTYSAKTTNSKLPRTTVCGHQGDSAIRTCCEKNSCVSVHIFSQEQKQRWNEPPLLNAPSEATRCATCDTNLIGRRTQIYSQVCAAGAMEQHDGIAWTHLDSAPIAVHTRLYLGAETCQNDVLNAKISAQLFSLRVNDIQEPREGVRVAHLVLQHLYLI